MNLSGYRFVSSNLDKLREYASYGFSLETIALDLDEVAADHRTVAIRKSEAAGPMTVIEDTALDVEGAEIGVNVRWLLSRLPQFRGRRAVSTVLLGVNDGSSIFLFQGRTKGVIVEASGEGYGFGYDSIFAPTGFAGLTMSDLASIGRKHEASPRAAAVASLLAGKAIVTVDIASLGPWTGAWQNG